MNDEVIIDSDNPDIPETETVNPDELSDGVEEVFKVKNKDGSTDVYIYKFDILTPARIFQAMKFIELHQEQLKNIPQTDMEVSIAAARETERHFYAAILCKQTAEDEYEPYNSTKVSSFSLLDKIRGKVEFEKLMRCKSDFFYNTNTLSLASIERLGDITSVLTKLTKEDPKIAKMLIDAAVQLNSTPVGKT